MLLLLLEIRHEINLWRTENLENKIERLNRKQSAMRRKLLRDADRMTYLLRNAGWEYKTSKIIIVTMLVAVCAIIGGVIADLLTK